MKNIQTATTGKLIKWRINYKQNTWIVIRKRQKNIQEKLRIYKNDYMFVIH